MKGIRLGMSASLTRRFDETDREIYRELVRDGGDDADVLGRRLPEALIGSMFSFILGTDLPGFGANYLKQRMVFHRPAYYGEELRATVTVVRLRPDKQLVNFETRCENGAGELVCSGEALVLIRDVAPREQA